MVVTVAAAAAQVMFPTPRLALVTSSLATLKDVTNKSWYVHAAVNACLHPKCPGLCYWTTCLSDCWRS